ncbi:vanadium-dependent haloperoxidase [Pontibacter sp. SGAir0037]|uniref:vanadium-dependent haloperoxidase n=1 Tax=Pontibacter sp. SGAir0037 TaxID=2571030 RepID=UPI0010CCCF6C|nr:vanadium-dependent haloperoxidase [Pontibacter sp. SGAir0037]QCR21339.1 phosphatidic acid phosphatase [Pontibacter sp. SGAir0037]
MRNGLHLIFLLAVAALWGCEEKHDVAALDKFSKKQLTIWNDHLSEVIIKDIFTPPVASRIYAYPNIAAYEALVPGNTAYKSLAGQLNELTPVPQPDTSEEIYYPVSSVIAFSTVGKKLVLVEANMQKYEDEYLEEIQKIGIREEVLKNSIAYGRQVGEHILAWSKADHYKETRALTRHFISKSIDVWQPTAPDYMPAVEPHWNKMRPFVIDSAAAFRYDNPMAFDSTATSALYKEAMEVYNTVNNIDEEKLLIARFWDDNPNVSYTKGHVTYFKQKLTPPGHWMSIANLAIRRSNLNMMEAAETYVFVTTAIADGFISCWDSKFKYNSIRPDTYIDRYIDENWEPILQTPPFPEFPSGHSVISAAAAAVLTHKFGDSFTYVDSTQMAIGLPPRQFNSFNEAAYEVGESRVYGGIHFRPACLKGAEQGKAIGELVYDRLKTRKTDHTAAL